jgi:hypothetical protein
VRCLKCRATLGRVKFTKSTLVATAVSATFTNDCQPSVCQWACVEGPLASTHDSSREARPTASRSSSQTVEGARPTTCML